MATFGQYGGLRTANDLAVEISAHIVEPALRTTIQTAINAPGTFTIPVLSTVGLYDGAQVVLKLATGLSPQIVTITAFDPIGLTVTFPIGVIPAGGYPVGSILSGATFPTQYPTDPLFTPSEVLSYIARAQNEFLSRCPIVYQFTGTNGAVLTNPGSTVDASLLLMPIIYGQQFYTVPSNAVELERVAYVNSATPPALSRLQETSQSALSQQDPNWFFNFSTAPLSSWYEDRSGVYGWGVAPIPKSNYYVELITSVRDTDTLGLADGFVVPDIMIHYVKYRALAYMMSKDGEERSPTMASLYNSRYERGVAIVQRYLRGFIDSQAQSQQQGG